MTSEQLRKQTAYHFANRTNWMAVHKKTDKEKKKLKRMIANHPGKNHAPKNKLEYGETKK